MTQTSGHEGEGKPVQSAGETGEARASVAAIVERLARMERKIDQLLEQPVAAARSFRGGASRDFRERGRSFSGHRPGSGFESQFRSGRYGGRGDRNPYGDRRPRSAGRSGGGEPETQVRPDPFAKFRKADGAGRRGRWRA